MGDNWLVLFKLQPSVITPDNLHSNILISSLLDSPVDTLYHTLHKVFGPVLLKDVHWSKNVDPKIQELLTELEAGLGSTIRHQGVAKNYKKLSDNVTHGILTPSDEYQFWSNVATASSSLHAKERAQFFQEQLQPLATKFSQLDSLSFPDVLELIEIAHDALDEIWKQSEHDPPYPESRMTHLLEVVSGSISRFVQRKLSNVEFWTGQFSCVHTSLQEGLMMCEKWAGTAEALTQRYWKQYSLHPWKGGSYSSPTLSQLMQRIEEVCVHVCNSMFGYETMFYQRFEKKKL